MHFVPYTLILNQGLFTLLIFTTFLSSSEYHQTFIPLFFLPRPTTLPFTLLGFLLLVRIPPSRLLIVIGRSSPVVPLAIPWPPFPLPRVLAPMLFVLVGLFLRPRRRSGRFVVRSVAGIVLAGGAVPPPVVTVTILAGVAILTVTIFAVLGPAGVLLGPIFAGGDTRGRTFLFQLPLKTGFFRGRCLVVVLSLFVLLVLFLICKN